MGSESNNEKARRSPRKGRNILGRTHINWAVFRYGGGILPLQPPFSRNYEHKNKS